MFASLPKSICVAFVLFGGAALPHLADAQMPSRFGPGQIWCASPALCHLHVSAAEDYAFDATGFSPTERAALTGPCQARKDCLAEISALASRNSALLTEARVERWLPQGRPQRFSAATALAGTKIDPPR